MNFSWMLFSVSDDALGSLEANLVRLATLAISVGVTLHYTGRQLPSKAEEETSQSSEPA